VNTGSGDIYAEQTGPGDVKAETDRAPSNCATCAAACAPRPDRATSKFTEPLMRPGVSAPAQAAWSSGRRRALTLDAETGSGSVHTDREMLTQGTSDRHHVTGKLNGGGPTVRIETGSGDIRVH